MEEGKKPDIEEICVSLAEGLAEAAADILKKSGLPEHVQGMVHLLIGKELCSGVTLACMWLVSTDYVHVSEEIKAESLKEGGPATPDWFKELGLEEKA